MKTFNGNFLNILTEYVSKNPDDVEVYSLLGTVLREAGLILKAVKIHRNILAKPVLKKNFRIKVMIELARDLYAHGNLEQTNKLIANVLKLDSKNRDALLLLFNIFRKSGDFEKAVDTAEKTPEIDAKALSSVYTDYANELLNHGEIHKAQKILRKAILKCKENIDALILLGEAELKDEDYKNAIENLFLAIDRDPAYSATILTKIENAFYQSNSFNDFSTRLRKELSDKNDNSDMHYALGKFLKKRGLINEAKDEFRRALEFNPTHIEAREDLIATLLDEKSIDRLKSEFKNLFLEIKKNLFYICTNCSHREKTLKWKCPACGAFNSYEKRIFLF